MRNLSLRYSVVTEGDCEALVVTPEGNEFQKADILNLINDLSDCIFKKTTFEIVMMDFSVLCDLTSKVLGMLIKIVQKTQKHKVHLRFIFNRKLMRLVRLSNLDTMVEIREL